MGLGVGIPVSVSLAVIGFWLGAKFMRDHDAPKQHTQPPAELGDSYMSHTIPDSNGVSPMFGTTRQKSVSDMMSSPLQGQTISELSTEAPTQQMAETQEQRSELP